LLRLIPQASRKVLTAQLRGLEADGLVDRRPLDDAVPKGVEYSLTAASRTLLPILQALHEWGVDHARRNGIDLHLPDQEPS
jgi:DNA-binding HxlR family transcriptional regulator